MRGGAPLVCVLFISLLIAGASAENCPNFQYTAKASTVVTGLTKFEGDLEVPATPKDIGAGNRIPRWGIFPFVEPEIDQKDPLYGILQPVLEWDYNYRAHQWTITPWYEDFEKGSTVCGNTAGYCRCDAFQKALGGDVASTKNYVPTVPNCHTRCEPKHGLRITAQPGDILQFTLQKSQNGESWTTTATNTRTKMNTTFETTCIKSNDRIRVGVALENSVGLITIDKNHPQRDHLLPGDIRFTNLKFTGPDSIRLTTDVDVNAKKCFPELNVKIGTTGFFGRGATKEVTIVTQQPSKHDEL